MTKFLTQVNNLVWGMPPYSVTTRNRYLFYYSFKVYSVCKIKEGFLFDFQEE